MNRLDFTQTGGFPIDQEIFGFIQENVFTTSKAAVLGGLLYVLDGCLEVGNDVGNGYVVINGETLPFVGGAKQDKVIIREDKTGLLFEDNITRDVQVVRYATFGENGAQEYLWSAFKKNKGDGVLARLDALEADNKKLKIMAAPFMGGGGAIVFWGRPHNEIPAGWQEYAGFAGLVPKGRVAGDPSREAGQTGGDDDGNITLTAANIPEIQGTIPGNSNGTAGNGGISFDRANNATVPVKVGSANPTSFTILDPCRYVEFITPIPNYQPAQ